MKIVVIEPVEKPENFSNVKFLKADWEAAVKLGPVRVPYGTAMENLRNSKGMYRIKPEVKEVEVKLQGLKEPEDMSNEELVMEMTAFGKPPRKRMTRQASIDFIKDLRAKALEMIGDDED